MAKDKKKVRELNGYRLIYEPDNPSSMKNKNWDGWIYEHIYIIEKEIGRKLRKEEVVHHLDFNRSNNKISNLLVISKAMHGRLHEWFKKGAPGWEQSGKNRMNSGESKSKEHCIYCKICGKTLQRKQRKTCSEECRIKHSRRVKRPTEKQLKKDIEEMSWLAIGRKYKVSDNAVRKWARKYNLI